MQIEQNDNDASTAYIVILNLVYYKYPEVYV